MTAIILAGLPGAASPQLDAKNDPDRCIFDLDQGSIVLVPGFDGTVAAGDKVTLSPKWTPAPSWFDAVPAKCLKKWSVSDRKRATLSRDHRTLTIAKDAAPGSKISVTAYFGKKAITRSWTVIKPNASPLVGYWHQTTADCAGREPLRELRFNRDGSFTATWMPFESYVDISGKWMADGDRLTLSDIGGNDVPKDIQLSGSFTIKDGKLSFATPLFGSPPKGARCDAPFTR